MTSDQGLAAQVIQRIAKVWQIDKARSAWPFHSKTDPEGFDWWPGDFRVRVRAESSKLQEHIDTIRLIIRTDVLKKVPIADERFIVRTALLSRSTSTYGWVYPSAPFWEQYSKRGFDHSGVGPTLRFSGSAYISPDNVSWLPDFLA